LRQPTRRNPLDVAGRAAQLVMTAEERMEGAAAMGNVIAELREGE
jgi:hypothetical protein